MNTADVIFSNFEFCGKSDLLVTVMVPEAEMNTAEVILSTFAYCTISALLVIVMVPEAAL